MSDERRGRRRRLVDDLENVVDEVNKVVKVAVVRGSEAAEAVGENLRDSIKDTIEGVRSARDSVVMVRVNRASLERLDELAESGIANSRSGAAAFLIAEGIKARKDLFDKMAEKIEEIRKAKQELRDMLDQDEGTGSSESG